MNCLFQSDSGFGESETRWISIRSLPNTTSSPLELFKGRHFDQEIILLCVRWYLSFKPSSQDLAQMMTERGIVLAAHNDSAYCALGKPAIAGLI
jgi:hypothetical protein